MNPIPGAAPTRGRLILAFAAVYVIWGSTYLAIRIGVETLPPFLMAATRFLVPGAVMYALLRRKYPAPTRAQWAWAALCGTLLLLGGNGTVTWAEQWVPSGLAALIVASVPLWMGVFNWMVEPTARPGARGIAGIVLGFGGVAALVDPRGEFGADPQVLLGAVSIVGASALWAAGSLASRRADKPRSPFLTTAMQMLCGSVALAVAGTLTGEWSRVDLAGVSTKSVLALLYLMSFGSVVALSAYVWLLQVSTPAKASTYAYVNPVVAVLLGWALAAEPVSARTLGAAAVIVVAVVMITSERPRATAPRPVPEPEPARAR
jgi:drug/metabolite transporter (DMT)-like permease